jgi:hypothetical protein
MRVEALTAAHVARLQVQPAQREWLDAGEDFDLTRLVSGLNAGWAGVCGDQVIAAAGLLDMGGGRGHAWGLISTAAGPHFMALHRAMLLGLQMAPYRRIETTTACNFQQATRWAQMLGFSFEGTMRAYHNGIDADLWARTA